MNTVAEKFHDVKPKIWKKIIACLVVQIRGFQKSVSKVPAVASDCPSTTLSCDCRKALVFWCSEIVDTYYVIEYSRSIGAIRECGYLKKIWNKIDLDTTIQKRGYSSPKSVCSTDCLRLTLISRSCHPMFFSHPLPQILRLQYLHPAPIIQKPIHKFRCDGYL